MVNGRGNAIWSSYESVTYGNFCGIVTYGNFYESVTYGNFYEISFESFYESSYATDGGNHEWSASRLLYSHHTFADTCHFFCRDHIYMTWNEHVSYV